MFHLKSQHRSTRKKTVLTKKLNERKPYKNKRHKESEKAQAWKSAYLGRGLRVFTIGLIVNYFKFLKSQNPLH